MKSSLVIATIPGVQAAVIPILSSLALIKASLVTTEKVLETAPRAVEVMFMLVAMVNVSVCFVLTSTVELVDEVIKEDGVVELEYMIKDKTSEVYDSEDEAELKEGEDEVEDEEVEEDESETESEDSEKIEEHA